jgi:hypothetical protein
VIGILGTTAGAIGGCDQSTCSTGKRFTPIDVPNSHVPFILNRSTFHRRAGGADHLFVATIYPSRQASKLDPAQALRYQ